MQINKALISAAVIASICSAQTPAGLVLHDGTPVRMRITRTLSSADAHTGDRIDFEVLDDVKVDDAVVIARGATALGTITDAEAKRRMARGGKLDLTIDYVRTVSGDKVAVRAMKESKGGGHTGAMTGAIVATSLVVWPAAPFFLFMHGKDTTIPKGTEITAYVDGEINVNAAAPKPTNEKPVVLARTLDAPAAADKPEEALGGIAVRLTSSPSGAEVDVDGIYWGTTPTAPLTRLAEGTHTITVKKIGYQHWERKIALAAGDDRTVNAELEIDPTKPHIAGLD